MTLLVLDKFALLVDYSRSVDEGRVAGNYGFDLETVTDKAFPCCSDRKGIQRIFFQVVQPDAEATAYDVIDAMETQMNAEPAIAKELLAVGEKYKHFHMLLALGSVGLLSNRIRVPALLQRDSVHGIGLWEFMEKFKPGDPHKYLAARVAMAT